MKSGQCPKCHSSEVYVMYSFRDMQGNIIPLTHAENPEEQRFARIDHYVCVRCHYTESYISERADVHLIRQTWQRADAPDRQQRMTDKYRTMPKPKPGNSEV